MTDSTINPTNVNTRHLAQVIREWTRNNRYSRYTGTSMNNVISQKTEAVTGRQKISIPLINRAKGAGQTGGGTQLAGNEEAMADYAWDLTPTYRRNAFTFEKEESDKPNFDPVGEARPLLSQWARDQHRDLVSEAFGAVYDGTTYSNYGVAAEGVKDTWLDNNIDRILFGDALGNTTASDHSASLAAITAAMVLSGAVGSLAKRMGASADSHIQPMRANDDEEWFVMFCPSVSFRDLENDTAVVSATRDAWSRGQNNPLFTGGDLIYRGVIYREVPELPVLAGVGAAGIDVAPNYLCGAQTVGWAIGMAPRFTRKAEDDYEFEEGVGIMFKDGVEKMFRDLQQNGMVTVYTAGVADA